MTLRSSTFQLLLLGIIFLLLLALQLTVLHFWNIVDQLQLDLKAAHEQQSSLLPPSPSTPPTTSSSSSSSAPSSASDPLPLVHWLDLLQPGPGEDRGKLQDLLHRKLFSSALHPFELKGFFHRAGRFSGPRDEGGTQPGLPLLVSLTTFATPERRKMLPFLAKRWRGHMSVVYRIEQQGPGLAQEVQDLKTLLAESPELADQADVHLVVDGQPFQFNLWRNIARLLTRAEGVLSVDVDFVPDPNLHQYILDHWGTLSSSMGSGRTVFVVPAFEIPGDEDLDQTSLIAAIPETKDAAVRLFEEGKLRMFHHSWFHGQGHTNYTRWLRAESEYPVETYHFKYEPYYLASQEIPFCDERFLGYGSNKCACAYEVKAAGYSFWVLPQSFLVHRPHPADRRTGTKAREKENQLNMEVMKRFMKDLETKHGYRMAPP